MSNSLSGVSTQALSFGGAISIVYDSCTYPKKYSNKYPPTLQYSNLYIWHSNFSKSFSFSSSLSCSPGANNAAGGAVFVSIFNADLEVFSSSISDSSVTNDCAAPRSETYSVGGGISVFRAGNVTISATNITRCLARGIQQGTNVLVSGGGVYIQNSISVTLKTAWITASGVKDAFSAGTLACGGGALATKSVSAVRISNCEFYDNSDSCLSGVIFLLQSNLSSNLTVDIVDSVVHTDPSISVTLPVLNISCGLSCSVEQQKRLRLNVKHSTLLAKNLFEQSYRSAVVMSLPKWSTVSALNSFLNCTFKGSDSIAVLVNHDSVQSSITCAPCEKPFSIATTSSSLDLSQFSSLAEQHSRTSDSCHPLFLKSLDSFSDKEQQCPFGFSFCSTIANISVGFWTSFTVNGSVGDAVRCPSNYCGCRNIPKYKHASCQLFPPFAMEYQHDDALCKGNRTGVLCGGCKQNFTQSLNGYSCISNEVCQRNMGWVWAVTVLGYLMYSIYIVMKSLNTSSDGLVMCVLFYGQISSFAGIPSNSKAQSQNSAELTWFSKMTQFECVLSLYENSCYGQSMGAYEATLAQLIGPVIVLVMSLVLTAAGRLQLKFTNFFRRRKLEFRESFGVTLTNVLLLLFSSVTYVVFQLITCVDLQGSVEVEPKRVFIDGTKACSGSQYNVFIVAAVILSCLLISFCAGLKFDKMSARTRAVVCSAYTDSRHFWIAVQLVFRFAVTVISATLSEVPSLAALAICVCTMFKLVMLVVSRPYVKVRTHCMDVLCHAFLIVQFLLQIVARTSESMGFSIPEGNRFYSAINTAATASFVLRYIPFAVCGALLLLDVALPKLQTIFGKTDRDYVCWKLNFTLSRFGQETNSEPQAAMEDSGNDLL